MNNSTDHPRLRRTAFTLIELLVVIAIIGVLAALIFPITGALKKKRMITVAQAGLSEMEAAIDAYKSKFGTYPPDNPGSSLINPLYYELMGTTNKGTVFFTKDGSGQIANADLVLLGVTGFVNVSKGGNSDDAVKASTFLPQLHANQIGQIKGIGVTPISILVSSVGWDTDDTARQLVLTTAPPNATQTRLTPWQYNFSHPINNPNTYDLWVDLLINGKTNRISNWSKQPQVL
jgi:prepilin-type N-terminal cleavage/methylation domain-containing protein